MPPKKNAAKDAPAAPAGKPVVFMEFGYADPSLAPPPPPPPKSNDDQHCIASMDDAGFQQDEAGMMYGAGQTHNGDPSIEEHQPQHQQPADAPPIDPRLATPDAALAPEDGSQQQTAVATASYPPTYRLEWQLCSDICPRAAENFRQMCQPGGATVGDKKSSRTVQYKGCRVLRLTDEILQSGDVTTTRDDGKGQESIYGPAFDDETFGAVPMRFGTLAYCNSGPNTNGSQFFICTSTAAAAGQSQGLQHLEQRHVAVGALQGGPAAEHTLALLVQALQPHVVPADSLQSPALGKVSPQCPITILNTGIVDRPVSSAALQ